MSTNLQIFKNEEFGEVRTVEIDGKPYFAGTDIAKALGYARPNDAINTHCRATVKHSTPISGKMQEINFISEGDLYRLIVSSKLPSAEKFERWVFDEVLPAIRKHGLFAKDEILDNPDLLIQVATALKEEREKRKAAEIKVDTMKPKALFADAVSASSTSILIGDLAKILKQNGIDIGQRRLFDQLRKDGFLMKSGSSRNMPTQKSMEQGLFEIKESSYIDSQGNNVITKTSKVTGKGQVYFVNRYLGAL